MPSMISKDFVFTVTKTVEVPDTDAAEKKTADMLTKQLEKLGFEVELEDVGLTEDRDEEDEEEDEFDDEDDDDDDDDDDDEDEDE